MLLSVGILAELAIVGEVSETAALVGWDDNIRGVVVDVGSTEGGVADGVDVSVVSSIKSLSGGGVKSSESMDGTGVAMRTGVEEAAIGTPFEFCVGLIAMRILTGVGEGSGVNIGWQPDRQIIRMPHKIGAGKH